MTWPEWGNVPCDPGFGLTLGLRRMMPPSLSKREEAQQPSLGGVLSIRV